MARFATIERAAKEQGVSHFTIRDRIKKRRITGYRLPGQKGVCVDLDQVAAEFDAHPARGYGEFGPDADIKDLTKVAAEFEVAR